MPGAASSTSLPTALPGGNLSATLRSRIEAELGGPPGLVVSAPGRVNLIGEHVDYNDGFVLPMAVERRCIIAGVATGGSEASVRSVPLNESVRFDLTAPIEPVERHWSNYVRGVVAGFQQRHGEVPGFKLVIFSDVPLGGGLSSSAALEVATATFLEALTGTALEGLAKARLCQAAEHRFAGVPCGLMDQYASVFARRNELILLDCQSNQSGRVPFNDPGMMIQIINTNVHHELVDGEYARRRAQCESAARKLGVASLRSVTPARLEAERANLDDVEFRRARHVITETKRTLDTAEALRGEDWSRAGRLMYESHASLRDDFEVSCPELDLVVELARGLGEPGGVFGCRLTGGGFGGCAVSLVRAGMARRVEETIRAQYLARTRIEPCIFASRPAGGAMVHSVGPGRE